MAMVVVPIPQCIFRIQLVQKIVKSDMQMIVTIGHSRFLCDCVEIPLEDLASLTRCSSCCECDPQRPSIAIAVSREACRVSGDWYSRVSTPRCSLGAQR